MFRRLRRPQTGGPTTHWTPQPPWGTAAELQELVTRSIRPCAEGPRAEIMDDMVPACVADVPPWRDWSSAADGVLRFLHSHVGWDVWMVTRVVGDRQVVLQAWPERHVPPGAEVPWAESLCRRMVEGRGPRLATVTAAVPAYAHQTSGDLRDIAAYVGVPLATADGQLFGTLCGVAFRAKPRSAARELQVVEVAGRMLSTLMAAGMPAPPVPGEAPGSGEARCAPNS